MSLIQVIKRGNDYMNAWPDEPILMAIFPEMRVKAMLATSKKFVPPAVALLVFWIYYICGGFHGLYRLFTAPQAGSMTFYMAVTSLIIIIPILIYLPIHGIIWFGYQADKKLNKRQTLFYRNVCTKLGREPKSDPVMFDLISIINDGIKNLEDKEFLNEL